ncbi:hypothetical protein [Nocardiopsis metallicus]|uniref:Uncharacterized protein n=1 Tax=Nocardiopsis metallicus TaxID=179819 RepID=A0A840WJN8_9ACTN|nr:hypothetical protein [Nocardiopsis metallicus]MBB5491897.1 hypothetical protein [Nocardiopsis metallicus]
MFITAISYGKHDDNSTADEYKPDRPVPSPAPDDGGSGGGKYERDDE